VTPPQDRERPAKENVPDVDALLARTKFWSPSLVELLYTVAKDQLAAEERRDVLLIGKANALLGVTGLSLTVAFTYGGMLLNREEVPRGIAWVYAIALLVGFGAAGCAICAMLVRSSQSVGLSGVLNDDFLKAADAADVPMPPLPKTEDGVGLKRPLEQLSGEPAQKVESTETGTTAYKRYLAAYYWRIYGANSRKHGTTAIWVLVGQVLYGVFLLALLVAGGFLWSSLKVGDRASAPVFPSSSTATGHAGIDGGAVTPTANDGGISDASTATGHAGTDGGAVTPAANDGGISDAGTDAGSRGP
jgi:hypothetical protein